MSARNGISKFSAKVVNTTEVGTAIVKIADGRCISAEISARIRVRFSRVRRGDTVACEQSPYDLSRVRIVRILKQGEI